MFTRLGKFGWGTITSYVILQNRAGEKYTTIHAHIGNCRSSVHGEVPDCHGYHWKVKCFISWSHTWLPRTTYKLNRSKWIGYNYAAYISPWWWWWRNINLWNMSVCTKLDDTSSQKTVIFMPESYLTFDHDRSLSYSFCFIAYKANH